MEIKQIETQDNIKVVTDNKFITAKGLSDLSLKARKLLYVAIAQCRKNDKQFYEFVITIQQFAELMGIDDSNIYQEADNITDELMRGLLRIERKSKTSNKNYFAKYGLFNKCEYEGKEGSIYFKLNPDMTSLLLDLKKDFCQPLLEDFLRMRSPYSMAVWHLLQKHMQSQKPGMFNSITFDVMLDEFRKATGTETKFKQIGQLKEKVLDKAITEIETSCGVVVTYQHIKSSRAIIGFRFNCISTYHVDPNTLSQRVKDKATLFDLKQEAKVRELTSEEQAEYDRITANMVQMELDFAKPKKKGTTKNSKKQS